MEGEDSESKRATTERKMDVKREIERDRDKDSATHSKTTNRENHLLLLEKRNQSDWRNATTTPNRTAIRLLAYASAAGAGRTHATSVQVEIERQRETPAAASMNTKR